MNKSTLLARREYFGYLFYDTVDGELFVTNTKFVLDFSKDIELSYKNSEHVYTTKDIRLVPSSIIRHDILSAPTYVEIYPTMFCNERCEFCYVGDKLNNYVPGLKREDAIKLVEDLEKNGIFEVSILGGEPFLYKDLPWLLDLLYEKGFVLSISTNGTIYNKEILDRILKYGVDLNFSFHSHIPEIHTKVVKNNGALAKTISTLRAVIKDGHSPHVSSLITKKNAGTILNTVRFLCEEGVRRISLFHAMQSGFAVENTEEIVDFETYKNLFLKAVEIGNEYGVKVTQRTNFPFLIYKTMEFEPDLGVSNLLYGTVDSRRVLYILYDGSTYSTFYKLADGSNYLGNIFEEGLHEMWTSNKNLNILRSAKPPKQCSSCEYSEVCRGGSVINYGTKPETVKKQPQCPLYMSTLYAE